MKQMEIFFNTVPLQGVMLRGATHRAGKQNDKVIDVFNSAKNRSFAAHEIWKIYQSKYEQNVPLTSIRRSITTLERVGVLQMTGERVLGLYGVMVNKWKVR